MPQKNKKIIMEADVHRWIHENPGCIATEIAAGMGTSRTIILKRCEVLLAQEAIRRDPCAGSSRKSFKSIKTPPATAKVFKAPKKTTPPRNLLAARWLPGELSLESAK